MSTIPSAERELLAMVLEAIDLPHGATVRDDQVRTAMLSQRLSHVTAALRIALRDDDPGFAVRYLKNHQQFPEPGYRTWERAAAELNAGPQGVGPT